MTSRHVLAFPLALALSICATDALAQAARRTAPATPVAPCTSATPECAEWVPLGTGGARSMIYRTFALDTRNERLTRAVVMVHGQGRDADNYFRTTVAAAFLAGALDDTMVISLKFASSDGNCRDTLAEGEVNWPCAGNSWRAGGPAVNDGSLTSYDFADAVLRKLARRDVFPNLRGLVLAGHSAGGQFASRYAMANTIHEALGVPVTYVVSNPSSYGYPDANRPSADGSRVGPFGEGRNCTTFNRWPYGLEARAGYSAQLPDETLVKQLVSRPVVYLMGELDTTPLAGFDGSCPAMAQGPNRFERATRFHRYVTEKYGASHTFVPVPLCGHNARCMFTAERALPVLFPAAP
ncbi:MAG: alpha/beta fold hydrolase [Vicinamibacterales bacterium]|nr:alpha/beta fold hydrolase [Vicinamibacterales bacterium]